MQPSEMEPATASGMRGQGEPSRAGRRSRLGALGVAVTLCLVVGVCAVLAHRPEGISLGVGWSGPPVPAGWQTYHDPLRLFSVRLPQEWTVAEADVNTGSFGDSTGSATEPTETIQFGDPALGAGSARFYVDATPIHGEFERHWYCTNSPLTHRNGLFHGVPVERIGDATWLFDTADAHFQLDVLIPGILGPPHSSPLQLTPAPTATQLPSTMVSADRAVLGTMLDTFQPTNPAALSCL